MLRPENLAALVGVLRRKLHGRKHLKMCISLGPFQTTPLDTTLPEGYRFTTYDPKYLEESLSNLNRVGNLGFWTESRFNQDVLATVSCFEDILLITYQDQVVGMCVSHQKPVKLNDVEIGFIYVDHRHRGKGLGKRIIQGSLNYLAQSGVEHCHLYTDAFRQSALTAYFKLGFEAVALEDPKDQRWKIVQEKVVKPSEKT